MWRMVGARCEVVMSQPTVAGAAGRNELFWLLVQG